MLLSIEIKVWLHLTDYVIIESGEPYSIMTDRATLDIEDAPSTY